MFDVEECTLRYRMLFDTLIILQFILSYLISILMKELKKYWIIMAINNNKLRLIVGSSPSKYDLQIIIVNNFFCGCHATRHKDLSWDLIFLYNLTIAT